MSIWPTRGSMVAILAAAVFAMAGFAAGFVACLQDQRVTGGRHVTQNLLSPGDATPQVRAGVLSALQAFQAGYIRRDTGRLDAFMRSLFDPGDDVLVLGTDESEWVRGFPNAVRFVHNDWQNWGQLRLRLDQVIVNSSQDVAWATAPGVVRFGRAMRPIRFTAILTRKQGEWRFRQIQFQWDDHEPTAADLLDPATYITIANVGLGRLIPPADSSFR
jgi:hypothetical protein